tara:strand:+ start:259 stop:366 length:108 start_codon:yes stop_codon:yes gene_type:complete
MSDRIEELLVGAAVVVAIVMSVIMFTLMAAVFFIA